jgi:hypothetical protein
MQKFILSVTVALGLLLSSVATLAQPQIVWVKTKGDAIPATAVAAGNEANGEKLYLCRMTNAAPLKAGLLNLARRAADSAAADSTKTALN